MMLDKYYEILPYEIQKIFSTTFAKRLLIKNIINLTSYPVKENSNNKLKKILSINCLAGLGGAAEVAYEMLCVEFNKRQIFENDILVSENRVGTFDSHIKIMPEVFSKRAKRSLSKGIKKLGYLDLPSQESFNIKNLDVFKNCDLLHLHNLHSGFFSPFALPEITSLKPTIYTLHDMCSFTGHCSHALDCNKWKTDCRNCNALSYYPAISNDNAARILRLMRKIYRKCSNITFVVPSKWLLNKAKQSIIQNHNIKYIPNGVDQTIYKPYDTLKCRTELDLPLNKRILLFVANGGSKIIEKGGSVISNIYEKFKHDDSILFVAIGGDTTEYKHKNFLDIKYIYDKKLMAKYYAAADLFIFPTKAETFGLVAAESLSCGTPVISFNTSAVPEIIEHMQSGYLAEYNNITDFICGIQLFLGNDQLYKYAKNYGTEFIQKNYTLDMCLSKYQNLYEDVFYNRTLICQ